MNSAEFLRAALQMVEYIIEYMENIKNRQVLPSIEPGYIRTLLPGEAPENPEKWENILGDIERVIMPGVTHWHSPHFHAYYPTGNSWPSLLADMLSDAIGCIGFTWMASPACTELETLMMDWLGKLLDLPKCFLSEESEGVGGGVIQTTASEATLVCMLAAKTKTIQKYRALEPQWKESEILERLIVYGSDQAHSSVERAALLAGVKYRSLQSNREYSLEGNAVKQAIKKDRDEGLIPFFVIVTLGTTPSCAFDKLDEIGSVCEEEEIWIHVDAAYAGSAFICPEYRHHLNGINLADSFNFNPHKWLMVHFDCSALWLKNSKDLVDAFNIDPVYLRHDKQSKTLDYRHWQIPLGRRFRSLKLWFVLRIYGAEGLRKHIRKQCNLAKAFSDLVHSDDRFEIPVQSQLGLVCFRLKGDNELSKELLKRINERKKIHLVPSVLRGIYVIRFAVCSRLTEIEHVEFAWNEIRECV
ncbi:aromatic-L-amino-acid decarboxylase-like [Artemia franciscana]|uniref:aromatic-L-amino-acid decarboxylase-like n=1 Tax=Artemia franciscana TaxID=6661 RepID=UPI0032DB693E